MNRAHPILPVLATLLGVSLYSGMDALMKETTLAIGAYSALLWRSIAATACVAPWWGLSAGRWPAPSVLKLHLLRGTFSAGMALTFFWGLARLPMAEAIALSFFAPLIALYLAAVLLGERIRRAAVLASLIGLAGVLVIAVARMNASQPGDGAAAGIAAIAISAALYAVGLIVQRRQAQVAGPLEVASFTNGIIALILLPFAPFIAQVPPTWAITGAIGASALLTCTALALFAWAYARAEAQVLVPMEYSAFGWAALMGWLAFAEVLTMPTVIGTALVIGACWIAVPRKRPEPTTL